MVLASNISLPGLKQPGQFQICLVYPSYTHFLTSLGIRITAVFGLVECSTGLITPAEQVPVVAKPGALLQGKRDSYGDRDVTHVNFRGSIVPREVLTNLSAALGILSTWDGVFRVYNHANPNYVYTYGLRSSTPIPVGITNYYFTNHVSERVIKLDGTKGVIITRRKTEQGWRLDIMGESALYNVEFSSMCTGNQYCINPSYNGLHCGQGWYKYRYQYKPTGVWYEASSSTSSNLAAVCFSAPTTLGDIASEVILANTKTYFEVQPYLAEFERMKEEQANERWEAITNATQSSKLLDFQWLEFFKDSYNWKALLSPLRDIIHVRSRGRSPKFWAELFLWFTYGVMPTYRDLKALIVAFKQRESVDTASTLQKYAGLQSMYGTSNVVTIDGGLSKKFRHNARVLLQAKPHPRDAFEAFVSFIKLLDVGVDFENIWELVPYSFVIDWFVNTGDYMKYLDYSYNTSSYDLKQLVISSKMEYTIWVDDDSIGTGFVAVSVYQRSIETTFPKLPFDFRFLDPSGHWLEGTALIVSRKS